MPLPDQKQEQEARTIAENSSFEELTVAYERTYRKWDHYRKEYVGDEILTWVKMDQPVKSSYQRTNKMGDFIETYSILKSDIMPSASYRGITLRQLRGVLANVQRRCAENKLLDNNQVPLTLETFSIADIYKYVVLPFTVASKNNFISCLPSTGGNQTPHIFINWQWSANFFEFVAIVEAYVHDFSTNSCPKHEEKGGGMTEDTPIWVDVFARNLWDFMSDIEESPTEKIFEVTKYRMLTIADKAAEFLQRIWSIFDIITIIEKGNWYIYTTYDHNDHGVSQRKGVGLAPGGATSDVFAIDTLNREKYFPTALIVSCIKYKVEEAFTAYQEDRKRILEKLTENCNNEEEKQEKFSFINNSLRSYFITPGTLHVALEGGNVGWNEMLKVFSKGKSKYGIRFNFEQGKGWDKLTETALADLIMSLPRTIKSLEIQGAGNGSLFVRAIIAWVDSRAGHTRDNSPVNDEDKLKSLQIWRVNNKDENKIWEEDLNMLETLAQKAECKDALLAPLDGLYEDNNPDFSKIMLLQNLYMRINSSRTDDLTGPSETAALHWALRLNKSRRSILFESEAGSYVKAILNHKFTCRENLLIIMFDLNIQLVIVLLMTLLNERSNENSHINILVPLVICWVWILFRELLQISSTSLKRYVTEASNWVDLLQISFILRTILDLSYDEVDNDARMGTPITAMCISWFALIFELSNVWFPLATFVTAFVEILIELVPFLFTTILIFMMFAHAFRAQYNGEECLNLGSEELSSEYPWTSCSTLLQSYLKAFNMFLTTANWNFDEQQGGTLTFLYAFIISVLLLNIIIAIVSNKFTDVQNTATKVFWEHRLSLITEIEPLWNFASTLHALLQENPTDERGKRFSFLEKSSAHDVRSNQKLQDFLDWWFSPVNREVQQHFLTTRLYIYYRYSVWEDIIYPGAVFERIVLGLKYEEKKQSVRLSFFIKFVKITSYLLFVLYAFIMIIIVVCGWLSFGLLFPKSMKEKMFHVRIKTEINDMKGDIDGIQKRLRKDNEKLKEEIREINEEWKNKFDELTALVKGEELS